MILTLCQLHCCSAVVVVVVVLFLPFPWQRFAWRPGSPASERVCSAVSLKHCDVSASVNYLSAREINATSGRFWSY